MSEYEESLYNDALFIWGFEAQKRMFIEEIGEVLTALNKVSKINNGCSIEDLINEFIDVDILLNQMKIAFCYDYDYEEMKKLKLKNLEVHLMD